MRRLCAFVLLAGCAPSSAPPEGASLGQRSSPLFVVGPRMNSPRTFHCARQLPSGRTLVAGGGVALYGAGTVVATGAAELFDPKTSTFRVVAPMNGKRLFFTMDRLPDGRVLAVGGSPGLTTATYTTEIFDEKTEGWVAGPPTNDNHTGHSSVALPDGRILVIGGYFRATVERFDPSTETWENRADMPEPSGMHASTLLPSGRILVTGGGPDLTSASASAFEYDPLTNKWTKVGTMSAPRLGHSATLLPTGRVLLVGGSTKSVLTGTRLDTAELYDPASKTFSAVGTMPHVHAFHFAVGLPSGGVLIGGGNPDTLLSPNSAFVERWDPKTLAFVELAPLAVPRAAAASFGLPDGRTMITGGFGVVALDSTEILTALQPGAACKSNGACESGFCRDGVCCDKPCGGDCQVCGAAGLCTEVVSGPPRAGHTCDGYACTAGTSGEGICRNNCKTDSDCASGFTCSGDKCQPDTGAKCTADRSRTKADNGVEISCGAYTCEDLDGSHGRCRTRCASTGECAVGFVCDLEAATCDPAATAGVSVGCALGPADRGAQWSALCALFALVRRRRVR